MPDLVIPPGFAIGLLRWRVTNDAEEMVSTIGLDVGDYGGDADAASDSLVAAWLTAYAASEFYTGWTFVGATVRFGSDVGEGNIGETIVNLAGTASGETPPQNVAVLVQKRTGLGGRRNRGRMYLPPFGIDESAISKSGVIAGTTLAAIQSAMDSFLTGLTSTADPPMPAVLFHSEAPTTPTPITALNVDAVVATQRTRLRR